MFVGLPRVGPPGSAAASPSPPSSRQGRDASRLDPKTPSTRRARRRGRRLDHEAVASQDDVELVHRVDVILSSTAACSKACGAAFQKFASASRTGGSEAELWRESLPACLEYLKVPRKHHEIFLAVLSREERFQAEPGPLCFSAFQSLVVKGLRRIREIYCIPLEKGKFVTQNQRLFESEYDQSFSVGSGGFGRCSWVVHKTTRAERVAKIIDKERCAMPLEEIEKELDILRDLDHPHIVRCFEWFESGSEFVIVMEVARGGDFDKALKAARKAGRRGLSETVVSVLCQQGFGALAYIHAQKVIHRDVKPANIFMLKKDEDPPHVLVADFGIADIFHFGDTPAVPLTESSKKGTWPYMAPEIFDDLVSPKSDVWAMGVVSWELLTGEKPFGVKPFEVHAAVCDDDPIDFGPVAEVGATDGPGGAVALLERLLARDEAARPTAHEAQVAAERWAPPGGRSKSANRDSLANVCLDLEESMDLQGLQDAGAFSKAAMLCMASQMDSATIEKLSDRFDRIDGDHDGRISVVEFAASFRELGYSEGDIETMVASLDVDHDGEVEYNEFVAGCMGADNYLQETAVRAAFSVFDVDGDGSIAMEEFEQILGTEGSQSLLPDGMRIDQEFAQVDTSSDGRITFDEFKAFVEKLHQEHAARQAASAGRPLERLKARREQLAAETAQYKALHARVDDMNARLQELLAGR